MRTILALLLMWCMIMGLAVFVGTHAADMVELQFNKVNDALREAGLE